MEKNKMKNNYKTDQENFWAGEFGNDYIERNIGSDFLASNLNFFSTALKQSKNINNCLELGANVGMNLKALKLLFPSMELSGIEINEHAVNELANITGHKNAYHSSIFDWKSNQHYDLTLIKGVLIHINPDKLDIVYEKLYSSSKKYILICEYYNPSPTTISYRGHSDRLFKRDFAGEMLDKFSDLKLVDYGFSYHRDNSFPQDDITWFLLQKEFQND